MEKYVLVTGGASGIGLAITTHLAENGYKVFCTDINLYGGEANDNIIPVIMDVTDNASIQEAYKTIEKHTDTLLTIINNAGIFVMDSMIEIPEEQFKKIIDINVFGMYRVNKAFLPLLKGNYSRIINISSEVAQYSSPPFNAPYVVSKYAVEAYSDALRRELMMLNIPVIKIRPGALKTNMLGNANENYEKLVKNTKHFKDSLASMNKMMSKELNKTNDPKLLAELVEKIIGNKKPKIVYKIVNSRQLKNMAMFPERIQDKLYKMVLTPKKKK